MSSRRYDPGNRHEYGQYLLCIACHAAILVVLRYDAVVILFRVPIRRWGGLGLPFT